MTRALPRLSALACAVAVLASCSLRFAPFPSSRAVPVRVSELVDVGDPARRASLRMVVKGLDADVARQGDRALSTYEEALRVDPTNPYAYLAIARHHAEGPEPEWALSFLDKADALFRAQGALSPGVEAHLAGLRGQALYASGELDTGQLYLERAWELAPDVWTDGRLTAAELR